MFVLFWQKLVCLVAFWWFFWQLMDFHCLFVVFIKPYFENHENNTKKTNFCQKKKYKLSTRVCLHKDNPFLIHLQLSESPHVTSSTPSSTSILHQSTLFSRPSSVDTTTSTTGADDEREEDDLDDELAVLSARQQLRSLPYLPPHLQLNNNMTSSSGHPNTPTSCSSSSTTPQPMATEEMDEEHDSFHVVGPLPSPAAPGTPGSGPRSLPYHRPVPVLHHFNLTPPPRALNKSHSPSLLTHHHHHFHTPSRPLPSPVQPQSLQLIPGGSHSMDEGNNIKHGKSSAPPALSLQSSSTISNSMSRSISDSTLRRAALHLNLNNQQSVLPSFTSLQQFKVWCVKIDYWTVDYAVDFWTCINFSGRKLVHFCEKLIL